MRMHITGTINGEAVDLIEPMQPDSGGWEEPRRLGTNGEGQAIFAPYWKYRMGFGRITVVQYERWLGMWQDGGTFTISLPHPDNGALTDFSCRVTSFSQRLNTRDRCAAAAAGVDLILSNITMT